jgi:hypothetical protein
LALNDFHRSDCKCARCYDPILLVKKDGGISDAALIKGHAEPSEAPAPSESAIRKGKPVFSGVLMYFPDAMMEIAEHSRKGNDKHNPGQPLHWDKSKSTDQADCIARHLLDIGKNWDERDPETGSYHATALAWRALALLQTVLERKKQ